MFDQLSAQSTFLQPFFQKSGDIITKLPSILIGFLVGVLVVRLLTGIVKWLLRLSHFEPGIRQVLGSIIELILWFFLVVAILQGFGFSNVILFFTSSVAALAIVMAAGGSTLISDIFAGIFIAQDNDFKVGDHVIVGPDKTNGIIEKIDARRTRLRDADDFLHILPNTLIERNEWVLIERKKDITAAGRFKQTAYNMKSAVIRAAQPKSKTPKT